MADIPATMPRYNLFIYNQYKRIRYPKSFDLPDVDSARKGALKLARVFMEVVPYWSDLPPVRQDKFLVEIVDDAGELVLTVPFSEAKETKVDPAEAPPDQSKEAPPEALG
ncbi:hypothetical protein JKG68_28165 [Microvirga aerilata]|uniref:DUF6894 domain-containing protein n=1 Tax=Microvirga aerilata TaxID=670292 RepID=A0A936ZDE5_9HYPH|nr:hypothetical protein [Microvirga aerilata]MBL0407786.1 hypothetical protein [Microvirga aerilata]